MIRLGCDIGGTFTDFLLFDDQTGALTSLKVLTTPDDPGRAVLEGVRKLGAPDAVIHGTTLVINAVIERKGAATALITTEGFRDTLETRREIRYDIYDIRQRFPRPLVERRLRHEVPERMLADGSVRTPLDEAAAREVLAGLGVESVAICLLHAYANDAHERRLAEIAGEVAPGIDVSLSADVLPEMQEFERTATTVVNAYVRPIVARYLARLADALAAPLQLMLSGGGVISSEQAATVPVRLAESGPVGGAIAARELGEAAGLDPVLAFDMGGTTAKTCLIEGGQLPITASYEIDRVHRFKRGSGTPISVPTVDLIEIGAGGGSVAAVDALGRVVVGPESAGADPGPAAYGRGGARATVTDANLLLGYLDPAAFSVPLDTDAAEAAIARDVAAPLGIRPLEAAAAIVEIVDETMALAARMYTAERGGDLDRAAMVAFGGGGPLHADRVARKLGLSRILVPAAAGVFSALGFLAAPVGFETARSRVSRLKETDKGDIDATFAALEAGAKEVVGSSEAAVTRSLEMRYVGQGHQLRVPVSDTSPTALAEAFAAAYRGAYGYAYADLEPQIVTYRVTATGTAPSASVLGPMGGGGAAPDRWREAWCPAANAMVPHRLIPFEAVEDVGGPALLEQSGCTIRVGAGARAVRRAGWVDVLIGG